MLGLMWGKKSENAHAKKKKLERSPNCKQMNPGAGFVTVGIDVSV
jgi:hypothetical protein